MNRLYHFAATYAQMRPVTLNIRLNKRLPRDLEEFSDLCDKHNVIELYLWLSLRFPKFFIEQEICREMKSFAVKQIERTLQSTALSESYAYGKEYVKLRTRLAKEAEDLYPPEEFGVVRETAMKYLDAISKNLKYVAPPADEEDDKVGISLPGGYAGSFGFDKSKSDSDAGESSIKGRLTSKRQEKRLASATESSSEGGQKLVNIMADVMQAREDRKRREIQKKLDAAAQPTADEQHEKMVELLSNTD